MLPQKSFFHTPFHCLYSGERFLRLLCNPFQKLVLRASRRSPGHSDSLAWVVRSLTWCLFAFAVICPSAGSSGHPDNSSMIFYNDTQVQQFERWWSKSKTVPFYLIGLLLPLLNFKSPSFFSKFNILGKVLLRSMSGESHLPSCVNLLSLFIHVIL